MKSAFPTVWFGLMVGIEEAFLARSQTYGLETWWSVCRTRGMVEWYKYDFGKAIPSGFERTDLLNTPPTILLTAVANLRTNHDRGRCRLLEYFPKLDSLPKFAREEAGPDILFKADYNHVGGAACEQCSKEMVLARQARKQKVIVHYGTIASGN
jgi:hypothetical protein